MSSAAIVPTATVPDSGTRVKTPLALTWRECQYPVLYMLSLGLMGYNFPPAYLCVIVSLIHAFRNDRYDFLIISTLCFSGYGLLDYQLLPGVNLLYLSFALSYIGVFIYRKNRLLKRYVFWWLLYMLCLFAIALVSRETMRIQFSTILKWGGMVYVFVPLMLFSGQQFDIHRFYRKVIIYGLICCAFYVIDTYILCGSLLMSKVYTGERIVDFFNPDISPLSFDIKRKFPSGLFFLTMSIYPLSRYYTLNRWQWVMVLAALISTQTFTLITGMVFGYILFQGRFMRLVRLGVVAVIALFIVYHIDASLGYVTEANETTFRVKSSIDQILAVDDAKDEEDQSKFMSGRFAQAIPKFEIVTREGRWLTGLGFLSSSETTVKDYIITNELYENVEKSEEIAAGIEICVLQVLLSTGIIGLIIHLVYFIGLWQMIRKYDNAMYFLSVLIAFAWLGIGGLCGWIDTKSLFLLSIAFGAVLLSNPGAATIVKRR